MVCRYATLGVASSNSAHARNSGLAACYRWVKGICTGAGHRGFEHVTLHRRVIIFNDWMTGKWRCFGSNARNVPNGMRASQVSVSALPDYLLRIPEAERYARTRWTEDRCVIDEQDFFVRACMEVPIVGASERSSGVYGHRSANGASPTVRRP